MKAAKSILNYLFSHPNSSSSVIAEELELVQRTAQRALSGLLDKNKIVSIGNGKNTLYSISNEYRIFGEISDFDLEDFRLETEDPVRFNFDIFRVFDDLPIFSESEMELLSTINKKHQSNLKSTDPSIQKRELERLIVEFSWKSSKIEGNTYSLLETEKLLSNNTPSDSHTTAETQMVLNHKKALEFIIQNKEYFQESITTSKIIEIHTILTDNLEINRNFRSSQVGITGSLYQPIGDVHQIQEAMDKMVDLLKNKAPIEQALLVTLLISYIQPFNDGNKRTARLMANAILFAHNLPLLSYRNTSVDEYKIATIIFYEKNNISKFKDIFISQLQYFVKYYF